MAWFSENAEGERRMNEFILPSDSNSYGILAFSHVRWDFVWQRPQQLLSRFAKRHRVLFFEEPRFEEGIQPHVNVVCPMKNVFVATPRLPRDSATDETMRFLLRRAVAVVNSGDFDSPLLWYYSPMQAAWSLGRFRVRGAVYDCTEEVSQLKDAPESLVRNEARLLSEADIVFTSGQDLYRKKSKLNKNVHALGGGVDYTHFAQAQDVNTPVPMDIEQIGQPIIGWFGVIDERMDCNLLAQAAAMRPDWNFVLIGPVTGVDSSSLPHANNIHWFGKRDYVRLPAYCRAFDVCMMPFTLNESTDYINPAKALEYFATGLPVVSTPVKDVVRQYRDIAYIAGGPKRFVRAVEQALEKDPERTRKGINFAKGKSWEAIVSKMQKLIAETIGEPAPRKTLAPMPRISSISQPAQGHP